MAFVEVKSGTYVEDSIANFPDRQTARGRRHLRSFSDPGDEANLVFVVQRPDGEALAHDRRVDPEFARVLEDLVDAVVGIHDMATAFRPATLRAARGGTPDSPRMIVAGMEVEL